MNKNLHVVAVLLPSLLLAAPMIASADDNKPASIALIPHTGTLGHGVDLSLPLAEKINLRLGFGRYTKTRDVTESDVSYTGKLTLGGGLLVADWFPFGGNFRLSGGLVKNQSKIEIAAKPTGTVTFNNTTYNGSDISVNGKISYAKTAPYIGLGYGNPSARGRFGFFGEFGVIRQKPKATLSGVCSAGSPTCDGFQADLAAEEASLQEDVNKEKWFPVIQLGMSVRF